VRLLRNAGKATDRALFAGAKLATTASIAGGPTSTTIGRTRDGRSSSRDARGAVTLTDYRSGRGWLRIADLVAGLEVTPEQLAAVLASLGRPGASWAVVTSRPTTATRPSGTETELVGVARTAPDWRWKRAAGITTWRLAAPRSGAGRSVVLGLDRRQRIVREDLTMGMTQPMRLTARASVRVRYGDVTPVVLPTDAQSVGFFDLLMALLEQGDDAGRAVPVGDATARAAAVGAQIEALRAMSGR
jgi:hypothetical protein